MNITFLIPPVDPNESRAPDLNFGCNLSISNFEPLLILYPASKLEQDGHAVRFREFSILKESWQNFRKWIASDSISDAYCISTVFLSEKRDRYAVKIIRELKKDIPIVMFGPEPSGGPDRFVIDKNIYVVRGEPECTMSSLFRGDKLESIPGLSWFDVAKNHVVHNGPAKIIEDLDKLPFPARHLIKDRSLYFSSKLKGRPMASMMTSRQCFGNCTYCIGNSLGFSREIEFKSHNDFKKPPVRQRSPENIYHEFAYLKKHGYKSVVIMDDEFIGGRAQDKTDRIIEICDYIAPLKMEWGCLARCDTILNEPMLRAMKRAGCRSIDLGVESFEQDVLNDVKKGIKVGDIYEAIFLLRKVGITPKINILLGASKYQTEESIKWTVEVLKHLPIEIVSFAVVIPHPWTEFGKRMRDEGRIKTETGEFKPGDPYRSAQVDFESLSSEKLEELVGWCYRSYYLRPRFIWKRIKRIRSISGLSENIAAFANLFDISFILKPFGRLRRLKK